MQSIVCSLILLVGLTFTCTNPHHNHNELQIPRARPAYINFTSLWEPFDLSQVTLTKGSIQYQGQELNKEYIRMIDLDRLLYSFYKTAGLVPPKETYGGWESPDSTLRGNFIGMFVTAVAKSYASTQDLEMKAKVFES